MSTLVVFTFLITLAVLLGSTSMGLRYYESRRRQKLVSMLRTVTSNGEETQVNLLMDADKKKNEELGAQALNDKLTRLLSESGLGWTLQKLYVSMAVTFVVGCILGLRIHVAASPALKALVAGICTSFLPILYVMKARGKRMGQLEEQLPEALDFLARSMRAGHAFTISLEMVGQELADPLGQEFRALFNEQNLGASLERAFENFARRVPLPDVRFFASAVLLQRQTGGNLSEILNRLSHIIRERFQLKGKVKAASAHGRITAMILTLLPIATLGGLILTSPGYLDPLVSDPLGRKLVAAGIVAQVIGNFFIRKIISIKV